MKQVDIKRIVVISKWYDTVEAAAYCGLSRSTFFEEASKGGLPSSGNGNRRRYKEEDLDLWITHGMLRYPGTEEAEPGKTRGRQIRHTPAGDDMTLVDPNNGKVYGGRIHKKQT